jgi:hypothetical protein
MVQFRTSVRKLTVESEISTEKVEITHETSTTDRIALSVSKLAST